MLAAANVHVMTRPQRTEEPEHIGSRIRHLREMAIVDGKHLAARELDRLARRTEGHVALIESRPHAGVEAGTVADYARVLGVTTDYLISGTGEQPKASKVIAAVTAARSSAERN